MSDRGAERRNIYVGNIGHDTPRQEVEKFFAGYGDVRESPLPGFLGSL